MKRGDLREYQRVHRLLARRPTWNGDLLFSFRAGMQRSGVGAKYASAKPKMFTDLLAIHAGYSTVPAISHECAGELGILAA